jgi:predicted amidohydrolase
VVAPEMGISGYIHSTRSEAFENAEIVPEGPTVTALQTIAKERKGYIVLGILEKEDDLLYNTAALIGPDGYIGKYRKNHLWGSEKTFAEPGNLGFPVFELPFGRLGMCICYDGWHAEVIKIYQLQGADIVCDPTNWLLAPGIDRQNPIMPSIHLAQAHMNKLFVVCSDRIGSERGTTFIGNSCICGPAGFIKGPASFDKEEILIAEINLMEARQKVWSPYNHIINDRRTDLYDEILGYEELPRPS